MTAVPSRRGFTLVELLAAISLVAVLGALLITASAAARARAQTARCLANMREVGVAALLHAHEHGGRLPSTSHHRDADGRSLSWTRTLEPYLGARFIGCCAAQTEHPGPVSYAWNDFLAAPDGRGLALGSLTAPYLTFMLAETVPTHTADHLHLRGAARGVTPAVFRSFVHVQLHGAGANYLFADGHVRTLPWSEVQRRLAVPGAPFVHPQ